MISSSRGTSHLFAISQECLKYDATNKSSKSGLSPNSGPQTLSVVSKIRSGNSAWKNVVTGAAVAASGRVNNSYSGVISSTFYKCKGNSNNIGPDLGFIMAKYHMLVFSSSGCVIQYALWLSSEVDSVPKTVMFGLNNAYESCSDHDSRLIVEPIQKWNICHKQNMQER